MVKSLGKAIGWADFTDPIFLIVLIVAIGVILYILLPKLRRVKQRENFSCDMAEFFSGGESQY